MNYYLDCLKNYAKFDGRARRMEYWVFSLFNIIVGSLIFFLSDLIKFPLLATLYIWAVFVPFLAVSVRRLHDVGKSWPWLFITLIPVFGMMWYWTLMLQDSQPGENKFGINPKGIEVNQENWTGR